jgi:hypothetical protein
MRKTSRVLTLLAALLILCPAVSFSRQKDGQNKDTVTKEEAKAQDYANLAQVKEIVGRIGDIDLKAGSLTLTIESQRLEPNADAKVDGTQQQKLMLQYSQIMALPNSVKKQQMLVKFQAQLQQLQASSMFKTVKFSKDYELPVVDKLKVARAKLEQKYTDEGEIIKYSAADLKKMKSPDITGAFIAAEEDLKSGLMVKLYLTAPKKLTTKDKQATASPLAGRPQVKMVLIGDEGSLAEPPDPPKKK